MEDGRMNVRKKELLEGWMDGWMYECMMDA